MLGCVNTATSAMAQHHSQARRARPSAGAARAPRPLEAYAWLQAASAVPGVYVPQVGDSVAYLQQGHALYLANVHDQKTPRPWEQVLCVDLRVDSWLVDLLNACQHVNRLDR